MTKLYLITFLILVNIAHAKKYALIISGPGTTSNSDHEFARNTLTTGIGLKDKGYEVSVLFSGIKKPNENSIIYKARDIFSKDNYWDSYVHQEETQAFPEAYSAITRHFPNAKSATKNNIQNTLNIISSQIKPGDTFTMSLGAHGINKCRIYKNIFEKTERICKHMIEIVDFKGRKTSIETKELFQHIIAMDRKGVNVNLIFNSCHSGELKKYLKDLRNTCSIVLSSEDAVGFGCFEDDPPFIKDYTSTLEYVLLGAYHQSLEKIYSDPYLQKSKCLSKVVNHAKRFEFGYGLDTNINDIFWNARLLDETLQESSISDIFDFNIQREGLISEEIYKNSPSKYYFSSKPICIDFSQSNFNDITSKMNEYQRIIFYEQLSSLKNEIDKYNQHILESKKYIMKYTDFLNADEVKEEDIKELEKMSEIFSKTDELAAKVITAERSLFNQIRNLNNDDTKNNCNRPF